MRVSALARILFAVYVLLTVYASLYPMEGWRDPGISPFAYLTAPLPRYITRFDVLVNILGYVPYGFLGVGALHPRVRGTPAFLAVALSGLALAVLLEALQTYLPTRFPSNVDASCNLLGAAAGAAFGLRYAPHLFIEGPVSHMRHSAFLAGSDIDAGLVLIGLWLFLQLHPGGLLFGAGDLREFLGAREGRVYRAEFFIAIEAVTAAANFTAVALLLSALAAPGAAVRAGVAALLLAAIAVKTAAFAIVMHAEGVLAWVTPGAQIGLLAGAAFALLAVGLPRFARLPAAAMLMMAATVFVNLAPPNPYVSASVKVWQHGHFLNFNGLTRLLSAVWPFAALGYLMMLAARRPRE